MWDWYLGIYPSWKYESKLFWYMSYIEIPHLTDCFRKLNIGGAACLLDKISLKKRTLDFSMWLYKKCLLILKIVNVIIIPKLMKYFDISSRIICFWPFEPSSRKEINLIFLPCFTRYSKRYFNRSKNIVSLT